MWHIIPTNLPFFGGAGGGGDDDGLFGRAAGGRLPDGNAGGASGGNVDGSFAGVLGGGFYDTPRVLFLRACPVEDGTFTVSDRQPVTVFTCLPSGGRHVHSE